MDDILLPGTMPQKISNSCLYCKKDIIGRQLALGCSICLRWQHRKCNMGIDIVVYRVMVQGTVPWKCVDCRPAPKEPESIEKKDLFLNYFSLGRSICLTDSSTKHDAAFTNNELQQDPPSKDPLHNYINIQSVDAIHMELFTEQDIIGDEITSDIPWLPKIENVYSEASEHVDESFILHDNMDDEPSFSIPWLPKIVSVYSEALVQEEDNSDLFYKINDELNTELALHPVIGNVKCEVLSQDINIVQVECGPVYRTCMSIENCPTCNTVLVPMQFTVNIVTVVMKTVCQCGLSIEIDPKPSFSKSATVNKKRKRSETSKSLKRLRFS